MAEPLSSAKKWLAWGFLYSFVVLSLFLFGNEVIQSYWAVSESAAVVKLQRPFFFWLLPLCLPLWQVSLYLMNRRGAPKSAYNRMVIGVLIGVLLAGVSTEIWIANRMSALGYIVCKEEQHQGLLAWQVVYRKDEALCHVPDLSP